MTKVIVFTDIHFDVNRKPGSIDPVQRLEAGLTHVSKYNPDTEHVIITGDLTDKGDPASYELLKETLARFDLPVHLLIGNHDNRANFLGAFTDRSTDRDGHIQSTIDTHSHRLILLDTLDGPPYDYPKSHCGLLCESRLSWLDEQLIDAGPKPCVIFMHHPPHKIGFAGMDIIRLADEDAFYEVLQRHNNVQHISCGHVHRTISGNHRGISFSVFKSTTEQMPMLFDLVDTSVETGEPAAYGILKLHADGITVHTEDYELTDLELYADRQDVRIPAILER